MSERDVLMRFGLVDHPTTGPVLQKLGGSVRATMTEVSSAIGKVGDAAISEISRIEKAAGSLRGMAQRTRIGISSGGAQSYSQFSSGMQPPITYASSYGDQISRLGGLSTGISSDLTMISNRAKKDADTYASSFRSSLSEMKGISDGELSKLVGTKEQFARLGKDLGEVARESVGSLYGASGKSAPATTQASEPTVPVADTSQSSNAISDIAKEYDKLGSESDKIKEKLGAGFTEFTRNTNEAAEGLARVVSGFAVLGLKDKELKTVIDTLLTIKGASDLFVGFAKTVTGVTNIFSQLGERQVLQSRQQEIANEKQELANMAVKEYASILKKENISIEQAAQGNKELAAALERVSFSAEKANQSTKELVNSQRAVKPTAGGGRPTGGATTRGGGAGQAIAQTAASEAVYSGGNASSIGSSVGLFGVAILVERGVEALLKRFGPGLVSAVRGAFVGGGATAGGVAAGAGAGALGGAAAVGAGASIAAMAGAAAAAAAALGSVGLEATELVESFSGASKRVGSITDRIATAEVSWIDWIRDKLGNSGKGFDLVGGSEQAARADKAIEKRTKFADENEIKRSVASEVQAITIASQSQLFARRIGDMDAVRNLNAQTGVDRLNSLSLQRDNLGSDIAGEKKLANLLSADRTDAGQSKLREALERISVLERQRTNVNADMFGVMTVESLSAKDQLNEKQLAIQSELAKSMKQIEDLSEDELKNAEALSEQRKVAIQLTNELKGVEEDKLALIRTQAEEQKRANEQGLASLTQRLSLVKQEHDEAKGILKSGAERFAQMNLADQNAAKRAMRKADAGQALTDRDRSLLRASGTSRAVAAAEAADMREAEQKGFFRSFGQEERLKVNAAKQQERQIKVDIVNKEAIQVKIDLDYQKMAADVIKAIQPMIVKASQELNKNVDAKLKADQAARVRQGITENSKARTAREAS